jgi:hypothetical protein
VRSVESALTNYTKAKVAHIRAGRPAGKEPNFIPFRTEVIKYIEELLETSQRPGMFRRWLNTRNIRSERNKIFNGQVRPPTVNNNGGNRKANNNGGNRKANNNGGNRKANNNDGNRKANNNGGNRKANKNRGMPQVFGGNGTPSGLGRKIPLQARNTNINKQFLSTYRARFGQNKNFPGNYNNKKNLVIKELNKYPVWHLMRHGPTRNAIQVARLITNKYPQPSRNIVKRNPQSGLPMK